MTEKRSGEGPLQGVRVLDLTEHLAGPLCTLVLGDMGAEVIKVERPGKGDHSRGMGDGSERNPYFRFIARNKKGITLDYKTPEGKEIFFRLVDSVDILVENYRPTVMERAGLGYEVLAARNPRLIYATLSGFGYDGPYRGKGGFDLIAQGMGGIMHVTGEPDGPPTSVGLPICDFGTGMWGATGILAALFERHRTGMGQRVECSLLETAVAYSSWTGAGWLADHKEPVRMGSRHRQNAPYQRYLTQDGYLMIGGAAQPIWQRCAAALGHPEWATDARFEKATERRKHRFELEKEMQPVLLEKPTAHWLRVLDEAGVPCAPVNTYKQLFSDPQVVHRQMVVMARDEQLGEVPHIRTPIRLSESHVGVRSVAPRLGQHNGEVLSGLGLGEAEIAALREKKVI